MRAEIEALRATSPAVLVGTPGRIKDVLSRSDCLDMRQLEVLVLDEADVLLDMGFREAVDDILAMLPKQRRTGLFSATQTQAVQDLARAGLRNPATVRVQVRDVAPAQRPAAPISATAAAAAAPGAAANDSARSAPAPHDGMRSVPASLRNFYMLCRHDERLPHLLHFLRENMTPSSKVVVFFATCAGVDFYGRVMGALTGAEADGKRYLHANPRAERVLREFAAGGGAVASMAQDALLAAGGDAKKKGKQKRKKGKGGQSSTAHAAGSAAAASAADNADTAGAADADNAADGAGDDGAAAAAHTAGGAAAARGFSFPPIFTLHGRMAPKRRTGTYESFVKLPSAILLCTDVAARGIDVPGIDWIVQFEPPNDPAFFVHRVGRTARAGRAGRALVFLHPKEDTYVHFLSVKHVPVDALAAPDAPAAAAPAVWQLLRRLATTDRELMEQGARAFVSAVRAYKEHQCQFIFRFAKLDIAALARAHGLLRMPRMPDLRGRSVEYEELDAAQVDAVQYCDAARERQRLQNLADKKQQAQAAKPARHAGGDGPAAAPAAVGAASKPSKAGKAGAAGKAPSGRAAAKLALAAAVAGKAEDGGKRKRKGKHQRIMEEWERLAREERAYKRLKRGKISQAEYELELRGLEEAEEADSGTDDDGPAGARADKPATKRRRVGSQPRGWVARGSTARS